MSLHWNKCLNKRRSLRTEDDLEFIYKKLINLSLFKQIHPSIIQRLCFISYFEIIEPNVVVVRQGDDALNWFVVINGSLDVRISPTGKAKDFVTLCTLSIGNWFGNSLIHNEKHSVSIITNESCLLLRVSDLKFFHENSNFIHNLNHFHHQPKDETTNLSKIGMILKQIIVKNAKNLIKPTYFFSNKLYENCMIGSEMVDWIIGFSNQIQNEIESREQAILIWNHLLQNNIIINASNNECDFQDNFYSFYKFNNAIYGQTNDHQMFEMTSGMGSPPSVTAKITESDLTNCFNNLIELSSQNTLKSILKKPPKQRTPDEVEMIYDELLNIKALSYLNNSIKKQLASIITYEIHVNSGTILFNQGDQGTCWYIIMSGSVNVLINGKGIVCTLYKGDDFGKLALINDSPRAATIITNEPNCEFLKIDKSNFDKILKKFESNTIRLKEHGKEVLILEKQLNKKYKILAGTEEKILEYLLNQDFKRLEFKNKKMLNQQQILNQHDVTSDDHDNNNNNNSFENEVLIDFLLTYLIIYQNELRLCLQLLQYFKREKSVKNRKKIIKILFVWARISSKIYFFKSFIIWRFIQELIDELLKNFSEEFEDEMIFLRNLIEAKRLFDVKMNLRGIHKWKVDLLGPIIRISDCFNERTELTKNNFQNKRINQIDLQQQQHQQQNRQQQNQKQVDSPNAQGKNAAEFNFNYKLINSLLQSVKWNSIQPNDELILRIYCADHTYTTLKMQFNTKAKQIIDESAEKLKMNQAPNNQKIILVEVKSSNEINIFQEDQLSVGTLLTLNGKLFISYVDHLDALVSLNEQLGPMSSSFNHFSSMNSFVIAYNLSYFDWQQFANVDYHELIFKIFEDQFDPEDDDTMITSNLDLFLKQFIRVQFWVITELLFEKSISKRVYLLKKFIKIAGHCKDLNDLSSFFGITMGLTNQSINRLTHTWTKLPSKFKRMFNQFEALIDPTKNHRKYRLLINRLKPPIIPFMPILLKDMTFIDQGNQTRINNQLVNFEKIHLISESLQKLIYYQSIDFQLDKTKLNDDLQDYFCNLQIVDNQKRLNQLSYFIQSPK